MEVLRKICRAIVKPLCHLAALIIYRVRIEGIENVPKNSACIVCGNHVHALDAPALLAVTNRKIRFMAKEELWKSVGFRFMAFVFYVFPVKRGKNDTDAIKTSIKLLKSNQILGMYPEGTRNGLAKGEKVKDGAAFFALRTGAKIVPVGISGKTGPFSKAIIRYGKPLDYSNYDKNDEEALDKITEDLMEKILELTK